MLKIGLPHNQELEESLIASIMLDEDEDNADIFDTIRPDDFYSPVLQKIYEAMTILYKENKPIDLVTVKDQLAAMGILGRIGGASYLAQLSDAPYPSNKAHYIKLLVEKSMRRKLLMLSEHAKKLAYDETTEVDEVIGKINTNLTAIDSAGDTRAGYIRLADLAMPAIERYERVNTNGAAGIKTGLHLVDAVLGGLQPGELTLVAARPGMGKTAFGMYIALHAVKKGLPVGLFSLEMSKEQIQDRIISGETGLNLALFRSGGFKKGDWEVVLSAIEKTKEWPLYIDDTPGLHYQRLRRRARTMKRKHNIKMVIIDYIQLMSGDKSENRVLEVASISRAMKAMAKEFNVPVVALSQLNRSLENRENKRPRLSDLRESGALEQDADNILFLYRDEVYNPETEDKGVCEVIVAKQRMGPTGQVRVAWIAPTAQFRDLETWHNRER